MCGSTLVLELKKVRPDLPVILCTGYSESLARGAAIELGARVLLDKPIGRTLLAQTVRAVLDS